MYGEKVHLLPPHLHADEFLEELLEVGVDFGVALIILLIFQAHKKPLACRVQLNLVFSRTGLRPEPEVASIFDGGRVEFRIKIQIALRRVVLIVPYLRRCFLSFTPVTPILILQIIQ